MNEEQWKYTVDVRFKSFTEDPTGKNEKLRMYFAELGEAFDQVLELYPALFRNGFRPFLGTYELRQVPLAGIVLGGPEGPELEVKLETRPADGQGYVPGLYYHFTGSIRDFEQRSGHDLSDFKGYDPESSGLLVAYLLTGESSGLEHTMAYSRRLKYLSLSDKELYICNLRLVAFGEHPAAPRTPSETVYQQLYFHRDAGAAVRQLLSLDFNRLREDTAWEKDEPCFYKMPMVQHYRYGRNSLELTAILEGPVDIGGESVREPGVYLHFNSKAFDAALPWKKLPKISETRNIFRVGTLDATGSGYEKVPGLVRILRPPAAAKKNKTGRKNRPT